MTATTCLSSHNEFDMKRLLTTLSIGLLMVGCASKVPQQIAVSAESQQPTASQIKVKAEKTAKPIKKPFSERIEVGVIRDVETNDGYRKVQVSMKNLTGESIKILYRLRWFDDKGIEVSSPNLDMWHSLIVIGGDEIVLSASAPVKNCLDVKLLIKEAVKQ